MPENLDPLAQDILERLRARPEAAAIVIGGEVALQHYCPFRRTMDIDAWWRSDPDPKAQKMIEAAAKQVADSHRYTVETREWGKTQSYEFQERGKTVFSFQISLRTTRLDPPKVSVWKPVKIESFRENLAER